MRDQMCRKRQNSASFVRPRAQIGLQFSSAMQIAAGETQSFARSGANSGKRAKLKPMRHNDLERHSKNTCRQNPINPERQRVLHKQLAREPCKTTTLRHSRFDMAANT